MHRTGNNVQKRELQYETVILWEHPAPWPPGLCRAAGHRHLLSLSSVRTLSCPLSYCIVQTHLIFRSLSLFSLSRFFRISMNWLKKCSWSFRFWTSRNLWSRPYFSANSLNVVLKEKGFLRLLPRKGGLFSLNRTNKLPGTGLLPANRLRGAGSWFDSCIYLWLQEPYL